MSERPQTAAAEIVFDRATKRYAESAAPAVDALSLTIPAGEICVLVGPSGGGKTTALKMVNRLITITEGDITIDGHSVRALDVTDLRRGIGYVIQQVGLFPHMTVEDNIATVPRLLGWPKARIRDRVGELLELVGLPEDYRGRFPSQLSGGQRQRVGLARALAADPPVMLMDEPFGAIDPITRARLQDEFLRLHREVRKTVIFVTHDIDEAIKIGDRIAILREGGVLAQYDTPDAILAHPASPFVAEFVGADRGLKRLALTTLAELELSPPNGGGGATVEAGTTLRDALSLMLTEGAREPAGGGRRRQTGRDALARPRHRPARMSLLAAGPVIPDFGKASSCVAHNRLLCPDWVRAHWNDTLEPALVQHIKLTLIAVALGFAIASAAALIAHRMHWFEGTFGVVSAVLYTIPSLALFQLLVPFTGITVSTVEIALVSYTLLILFRNNLVGLRATPPEVIEAARGMGLTRRQTLLRVEVPLALPAVFAGLRIAIVTTISLATVAAFVIPQGLGAPIYFGLQTFTKTEFVAAGLLAVGLALAADGLLVLAQRAITPWARARRAV